MYLSFAMSLNNFGAPVIELACLTPLNNSVVYISDNKEKEKEKEEKEDEEDKEEDEESKKLKRKKKGWRRKWNGDRGRDREGVRGEEKEWGKS